MAGDQMNRSGWVDSNGRGRPNAAAISGPRAPMRARVASSVRFRLTITVVLVVGLSLLGGGTLLVRWVEATLTNDLKVRNERVLESMAESITARRPFPLELFGSVADLTGQLDPRRTEEIFGTNVDAERVISTTYFYMDGDIPEFVSGVDADGRVVLFRRRDPPQLPERSTIEVTYDIPTATGVITLHAISSTEDIQRSVNALSAALWLGLPVLVVGSGIMTWLISGRTLAHVGMMTRRVRELSATTLDARVPVPPTDDEIAELARTMNEMLDRLQQSSLTQRQFVSDASHELRSPVASIRAQLETALRYPDDVDWPSVARIVLAEDERLEHLVGNLLAMARLEEGRLGPRGEVDLEDLVMAQTQRITGVDIDRSGVSAGRVWANADELTSVVRNLVDNAARYAESTVSVAVRENGPWVVLRVSDDGPGIPAEDRERVFERFARLHEGRSRGQGGTGLGLALTRRIVEHHGGRIHVEDASEGGASFVVSLPASGWIGHDDTEPAESAEPARPEADQTA